MQGIDKAYLFKWFHFVGKICALNNCFVWLTGLGAVVDDLYLFRMADSASESDSSSIDGPLMMPPSPVSREQLYKRIESLQQQNRVLKVELDTFKLRVKSLQEENRHLRQASVNIVRRECNYFKK